MKRLMAAVMSGHFARLSAAVFLLMLQACADEPAPAAAQTPEQRGRALAAQLGCNACHAFDTTRGVGPGWGGLYGATRTLSDGRSVTADAAYLQRSMREPAADIVAGFDNVMLPAAVTDAQLADIIAFIKELKGTP